MYRLLFKTRVWGTSSRDPKIGVNFFQPTKGPKLFLPSARPTNPPDVYYGYLCVYAHPHGCLARRFALRNQTARGCGRRRRPLLLVLPTTGVSGEPRFGRASRGGGRADNLRGTDSLPETGWQLIMGCLQVVNGRTKLKIPRTHLCPKCTPHGDTPNYRRGRGQPWRL